MYLEKLHYVFNKPFSEVSKKLYSVFPSQMRTRTTKAKISSKGRDLPRADTEFDLARGPLARSTKILRVNLLERRKNSRRSLED
jgi:hypothetical protein